MGQTTVSDAKWLRHHDALPQVHDLVFAADAVFDAEALPAVLRELGCERIKGSLQTADGAIRVDNTGDEGTSRPSGALLPIACS